MDQCEFEQSEQGVEDSCIQGKLRANFPFWCDVVRASEFALDIIQTDGCKILFRESPLLCIGEVLFRERSRGFVREAPVYRRFCNLLHVAVQSSGKLRLILDLSHRNKYEDS